MWHALRAEIAYARPWLLGGLGIAAGVGVVISVVFWTIGEEGPPRHVGAGMRGLFLIIAPMIVGFIVQAYRTEERRSRLLLAAPLTPRQLGFVTVSIPAILFGIGAVAAGLVIAADALITGRLELETLNMVGFVGGQMFAYAQLGLLVQEAVAAKRQRRLQAREAGWAGFVVAVLFLSAMYLGVSQQSLAWIHMVMAHAAVGGAAMVVTFVLFSGRTDFTR